jgi:cytochrome b561
MKYTITMRWLHWVSALAVVGLLGVGFVLGYVDLPDGPGKDRLYNLHESFGVALWCLVVIRLLLRQISGVPVQPASMPRWMRLGSGLNHAALYALLLLQPVAGLLANNAGGYGLELFNVLTVPNLVGKNDHLSDLLFKMHEIGGLALAGLVGLHVVAAAYHGVIRRDGVVSRMV